MTSVPNISWHEDGTNSDYIIAQVQKLLGNHPWLVFVPNPLLDNWFTNRFAQKLNAKTVPKRDGHVFVIPQEFSTSALRSIFEWGPAEADLMTFATEPDSAMIVEAQTADDARPAECRLYFDSNTLINVVRG
ncbi:hypothetical protein [Roseibium sp. MMSF_3412]|uniref:hypothetical protein n=1 Tax=Roseibium sp. MMSF_3412 TaxID=3046712 RepID=UPI00273D4B69|nr:hypothetical protein [Roseibium sp. MMSF_3412]